jgi:hypothetical protein
MNTTDITRDYLAAQDMAGLRKIATALVDVAEALNAQPSRGTYTAEEQHAIFDQVTDCTSAIYRVVAEARQREPQDILESIDRIAILAATARYNNDPNCVDDLRKFVGGKAVA